ncbi:hypothetical protein WMY93_006985 [Mugilogobius chulae]|uniref:Uncharacterized protein n=1 Tax=Mugilogobius chulae TaxID=88201 RepID=A0AAW0PLM7_9GOBI
MKLAGLLAGREGQGTTGTDRGEKDRDRTIPPTWLEISPRYCTRAISWGVPVPPRSPTEPHTTEPRTGTDQRTETPRTRRTTQSETEKQTRAANERITHVPLADAGDP